ncbi:unnamed protein product [Allacma fusca]|uniref:Uncharacterized protein n=1 Tax=Allacma fusca TaxID=39272 RepID=A0A8J2K412_9HEXA|nr:unnamed protein product [Allacma fusca]
MDSFDDPMDLEVLLGDLGSPISFISWEEEMEALLDNLPPESPPESLPESTPKSSSNSPHTPDREESFPNLTSNLSDHQVTTPTHHQQHNQSHSLVVPLMSLNLEETQPIDRTFKIPRSNRKKRER